MSFLDAQIVSLSYFDLFLSLSLVLIVLAISAGMKLGLEKDLGIGLLRSSLQLGAIGYLLNYIFNLESSLAVMAYLLMMIAVASHIVLRGQKRASRRFWPILGVAIFLGSFVSIFLVTQVVVRATPWWNPRYLIPIAGMIIGNAMTAAALALERLQSDLSSTRRQVETLLSLGATSRQAADEPVKRALRASMLPMITSMMGVGLVHLPGMMTGQIIAGSNPLTATRYQLVVMFMLTAAVGATAFIVLLLAVRRHFTPEHQLRADLLP